MCIKDDSTISKKISQTQTEVRSLLALHWIIGWDIFDKPPLTPPLEKEGKWLRRNIVYFHSHNTNNFQSYQVEKIPRLGTKKSSLDFFTRSLDFFTRSLDFFAWSFFRKKMVLLRNWFCEILCG